MTPLPHSLALPVLLFKKPLSNPQTLSTPLRINIIIIIEFEVLHLHISKITPQARPPWHPWCSALHIHLGYIQQLERMHFGVEEIPCQICPMPGNLQSWVKLLVAKTNCVNCVCKKESTFKWYFLLLYEKRVKELAHLIHAAKLVLHEGSEELFYSIVKFLSRNFLARWVIDMSELRKGRKDLWNQLIK